MQIINKFWVRSVQRLTLRVALLTSLLVGIHAPGHATTPSQLPLLSFNAPPPIPNLMITIDDSLTMDLISTPGSIVSPFDGDNRVLGYSPDEENAKVVRSQFLPTTASIVQIAKARSAQQNLAYYNPQTLYQPWKNSDGTSWPNADPRAALLDPVDTWRGTTDLVATQDFTDRDRRWCTTLACPNQQLTGFEPDVYFDYIGTNPDSLASYQRVRISDFATLTRGEGRTDCPLGFDGQRHCTTAQEHQNFANWYVYYRTRILVATAALSNSFAGQSEDVRLGYGRTNKYAASDVDGVSTQTIERGIREFSGTDRTDFFDWLYAFDTTCCTPLRRSVEDVGKYFERTDDRGPWSETPGVAGDPNPQLSCRKNYSILITDGAWTDRSDRDERADGIANGNVDGQAGPLITGPGGSSYQYSPEPPYSDSRGAMLADVAMYYWYRDLRPDMPNEILPDSLNPAFWQHVVQYTVGLGIRGQMDPETDLPDLTNGTLSWGDNKVDDLWHAALNGRGAYFTADNQEELNSAIADLLLDISQRDATEAGPAVNSKSLNTSNRKFVPSYRTKLWSGDITAVNLTETGETAGELWSASDQLPAWDSRSIYLSQGSGGGAWPFTEAGLPATVASQISNVYPSEIIDYLRGDTSREGIVPYNFRVRDDQWLLGDIVNSAPVMFGVDTSPQYQFLPGAIPGGDTYRAYLSDLKAKPQHLFVGANDGMLHALDAETGVETFALIPQAVMPNLASLASPSYSHKYFVDGPLNLSNAHQGTWKTVLTGTTGAGARAIFAIDVTDPESLTGNDLLWEFNNYSGLGYVTQPVQVGVLGNGRWVAVTGNGVGSPSGTGKLLILDLWNGNLIAEVTVPGGSNGLGGVSLITDFDNVIRGVYAGDQLGRVWRFDSDASNPESWQIGLSGSPLFQVPGGHPISAQPNYTLHPDKGNMVLIGTGQLISDADRTTSATQTLFGLWDQAPGDEDSAGYSPIANDSLLVTQTIGATVSSGLYGSSGNSVDWTTQRGWKMDLTLAPGLRVLSEPQFVRGMVLFETVTPLASTAATLDACSPDSSGIGYNFLLNVLYGSQSTQPILDTDGDGQIDHNDSPASIIKVSADGADEILLGRQGNVSLQSSTGHTNVLLPGRPLERTWRQILNIPR